MSNYTKATNFTAKDSLPSGNSNKIIKGAEIDTELTAVASAISSKADINSPTFTGTPAAPTASEGTNTTQIATTAYTNTAVVAERTATATLTNKTLTSPTINGGTISGLSSPLPVASGGTGTSTPSLVAGSGISVSGSFPNQTITSTLAGGTVTSVATGNGLQGGTITSSGTLSVACPSWGSIGSYATGKGTSTGSFDSLNQVWTNPTLLSNDTNYSASAAGISGASGTWKCIGQCGADTLAQQYDNGSWGVVTYRYIYIFCRVS